MARAERENQPDAIGGEKAPQRKGCHGMEFNHYSVLLRETVEQLNVKPDGIYVDGTLGGGGHAFEVAKRLSAKGQLFGIDQDDAAIEAARLRLLPFLDRISLFRSNF